MDASRDDPQEAGLPAEFLAALRAAPTSMLVVAVDGTILFANDHAESMFGQRPLAGRLVGSLVPREFQHQHSALRASYLRTPVRRAMGAGRELMAVRADGSLFPVEIGLNPFKHDGQQLTICSVIDISARKTLEDERQRAQAAAMRSQRLDSLGILAGGVAHDFNNLLVSVLGNTRLALDNPKLADECLRDVLTAAQQAADLARQMLAFSGRGTFKVERMDLTELVEDSRPLLMAMLRRRGELRLHTANGLPPVEADPAQLRQVLMNLVGNAGDAVAVNGGAVHIATGWVEADTDYLSRFLPRNLSPGPFVVLEVSDSGIGIPQELLPRLFEPFVSSKASGRGLGLAACLGIVRGHGGAIHVYSDEGRGTAFKVLLPAVEQKRGEEQATELDAGQAPITALVVDDDPLVRRFACRCLDGAGYRVLEAMDGREAVEIFAGHHEGIDVVLLDVTMPKLNGPAAFMEMRRIDASVPVVVTSGFAQDEAMTAFSGRPAVQFLTKPYTNAQLIRALRCFVPEDDH